MSRRLIIIFLIILILGILGGTGVLIAKRLGITALPSSSRTRAIEPSPSLSPDGDAYSDGLSNADELKWGALPTNPDTDGDGFKDGEEVAANHNPTIAGPSDKLPEGFQLGVNATDTHPLTISDIINLTTPIPLPLDVQPSFAPVNVDQYFQAGIDLSGGSTNLTEQYFQQYNTQTVDSAALPFIAAQPIITKLPTTYEGSIKIGKLENKESMAAYINFAFNSTILADRNSLERALNYLFLNNDPVVIQEMIRNIEQYQKELLQYSAPPSAGSLQRLLVGYTELLKATLSRIGLWNTDRITALVGIKQLNTIDRLYYPLINQEFARLNGLY